MLLSAFATAVFQRLQGDDVCYDGTVVVDVG